MGCLAILNISGTHVGSKGDRVVYLCPVCGYDQLDEPPQHYSTCPSCGTEFGYQDFAVTQEGRHAQWERLRRRWLARGAPWFSPVIAPPAHWNPYAQLFNAGMAVHRDAKDTQTAFDQWNLAIA